MHRSAKNALGSNPKCSQEKNEFKGINTGYDVRRVR